MRPARAGDLVIGKDPVLVATALADSVEGMLSGVGRAQIAGADCVELRIDRLPNTSDVTELVGRIGAPHIVACRAPRFGGFFVGKESDRIARLEAAIDAGAACVDIEFFTEAELRTRVIEKARASGIPVLVGYENMSETPSRDELVQGLRSVADLEPDLMKLAVRASTYADLLVLLGTVLEVRKFARVPFAAIALGPYGAPSRPLGCLLGGSFTYCAVESGAVPGQLTVAETRVVLEMMSEQRWACSSS